MEDAEARSEMEELQQQAARCRHCGECASVCDIAKALGDTPPGVAAQLGLEGRFENGRVCWFIPRCSLCRLCECVCPEGLDITSMVIGARSKMIDAGLVKPEQYSSMWVDCDWNAISLYRDTYELDFGVYEKERCEVAYLPGCTLLNEAPELAGDAIAWLESNCGEDVGLVTECCGMPLREAGMLERARAFEDRLWARMHALGARSLVVACPNCLEFLAPRGHREGVDVRSIYELMAKSGFRAPVREPGIVTVHDSCPARGTEMGTWIRQILGDYQIVEMKHHGDGSICCGSGGAVSMYDYTTRQVRAERRVGEFEECGAPLCVTYCMSSCDTLTLPAVANRVCHVLELAFSHEVDHVAYQRRNEAMWEGDWGSYNSYRLEHASLVSSGEERS